MVRVNNGDPRPRKRFKIQQSLRSMFLKSAPKFVEAVGIQPICLYCGAAFKAPQGLAVHLHMHERNGDSLMREKTQVPVPMSPPSPSPPPVEEEVKSPFERCRRQSHSSSAPGVND